MDSELSLHYTLSLGDDHNEEPPDADEDDEEEYFDPFEVKPGGQTTMNVDHAKDDDERLHTESKQPAEEKKDEIEADDNAVDANNADDISMEAEQAETEMQEEEEEEAEADDDDDEEEEEDDDLRKELEASWEKQEKEKNKAMIDLLESIKNKNKNQARSQSSSPQKAEKQQMVYPKLNPLVLQSDLSADFKITLSGRNHQNPQSKPAKQRRHVALNLANKRKQITHLLKKKMCKTRKREMRKYKKEFGVERDYYRSHKNDDADQEEEEAELDDDDEDDDIEELKQAAADDEEEEEDDDDDEEMEAQQYIANKVEEGEELDEEDLYRAALMAKPENIPSELRELLDIAADEEDEHGEVDRERDKRDEDAEQEEKCGIAKNLLAEKSEIQFLKQHKQIYDVKRNQIHQQLVHNESEQELELMKRAFVDGEYRKLQNKRKQQDLRMFDGADNDDGQNELKFKSRNFELDRRNEPEYYLSDNEEKNEFCCYNENGLFYDIYTIRMRIMEWNKNHNEPLVALDDEEDAEQIIMRQKRVQKRETMNSLSNGQLALSEDSQSLQKLGNNDKSAIKLLQRVRNKKMRKKPKLNKSSTLSALDTNFKLFYERKGLQIDGGLQRSNSQSFLEHRGKCVEVIKTNQSLSASSVPFAASSCSNNIVANKRVVVFQHQKQKRKRESAAQPDKNQNKRRRVQ